jgi:hypothetical protein
MFGRDLFSPTIYKRGRRDVRQPSIPRTLWRGFLAPHHEAWIESELNQREYCEAYGIPLRRAKFKAEPQPLARKVLYRRGSLSHALSHGLSHDLPGSGPIVPPRARVVVGGSAKQTNGRYFGRRCGRIRASPR